MSTFAAIEATFASGSLCAETFDYFSQPLPPPVQPLYLDPLLSAATSTATFSSQSSRNVNYFDIDNINDYYSSIDIDKCTDNYDKNNIDNDNNADNNYNNRNNNYDQIKADFIPDLILTTSEMINQEKKNQ